MVLTTLLCAVCGQRRRSSSGRRIIRSNRQWHRKHSSQASRRATWWRLLWWMCCALDKRQEGKERNRATTASLSRTNSPSLPPHATSILLISRSWNALPDPSSCFLSFNSNPPPVCYDLMLFSLFLPLLSVSANASRFSMSHGLNQAACGYLLSSVQLVIVPCGNGPMDDASPLRNDASSLRLLDSRATGRPSRQCYGRLQKATSSARIEETTSVFASRGLTTI